MAKTNSNLAKEWHPTKNGHLTPQQVIAGSLKKVWWTCNNSHEWEAEINARNRGSGCPFCAGKQGRKVLAGYNDLATTNPDLAQQWHPTKNANLTPQQVMAGSLRKVFWVCEKGHEWQAPLNGRSNGLGCPVCSNRKIVTGINDLATLNPGLTKEWHPTKNGDLIPQQINVGNNIKVWWICKKGHEWQASINHRNKGSGCPKCCAELTTSFPEKAVYFYVKQIYKDAVDKYKSHWLGSFEIDTFIPSLNVGIEYDGEKWHKDVNKDLRKNDICLRNNVTLIRIREKDCVLLNSSSIDYIMEHSHRDLQKAIIFVLGTLNGICGTNNKFNVNIQRDITEIGEVVEHYIKYNSLLVNYPQIAEEWHQTKNGTLTPDHVTKGSQKIVWWECTNGHEWQARIADRSRGQGCPICANKKVLTGYNDLATTNPQLAKEWHSLRNGDLIPEKVSFGSNKKVWWQCNEGHEWQATIVNRNNNGSGCPYCAGQLVNSENCLAIRNPELAKEWHPLKNGSLKPEDVMPGSGKKVWWLCKEDHEWQSAIKSRNGGTGCPICANRRVLAGYNDLATTNPQLAKEWHPTKNGLLKPVEVFAGSGKKVWWLCNSGHEWQSVIEHRNYGSSCLNIPDQIGPPFR